MESLASAPVNGVFTAADLTATGAETVYDMAAIDVAIGGVFGAKAAVTDGATPTTNAAGTTHATLTEDTGAFFLWCVNLAGTVVVEQSDVKAIDGTSLAFEDNGMPQLPAVPLGYVPFAIQTVKNTAAGGFDFGTDNWNQAGCTDLIQNLASMPSRVPDPTTA